MIETYSRAQVRAAEAELLARVKAQGDPDRLMRGAAKAVAERAEQMLCVCSQESRGEEQTPSSEERTSRGEEPPSIKANPQAPQVAVFAGGGDNGGDALYAAAFLAQAGHSCTLLAFHPHVHEGGERAARASGVTLLPLAELFCEAGATRLAELPEVDAALRAPLWIDGIFGTGMRGAPRHPLDLWLGELEELRTARGARVLAIDVPSGALEDSGEQNGTILRADSTVTMGAHKSALVVPPAAYCAGQVSVHDIGLDMSAESSSVRLVEDADILRAIPIPGPLDHKYTRGSVGLVAGSDSYPGAGILTLLGAGASGVGMIRLDAPKRVEDLVLEKNPGVVLVGGKINAGLVGPGMDEASEQANRELAMFCLDTATPLVIDAGALELVPELLSRSGALVPAEEALPAGLALRAGPALPAVQASRLGHTQGSSASLEEPPHPGQDNSRPSEVCSFASKDREASSLAEYESSSVGGLGERVVLTPHIGEAARLLARLGAHSSTAELLSRPALAARKLADLTGAHVLLKGGTCLLASPEGSIIAIPQGMGWTGVAGAGDVLAGLLAGLAASWAARTSEENEEAKTKTDTALSFAELIATGALIHARAGQRAALRFGAFGAPISAQEIAAAIAPVIGEALEKWKAKTPARKSESCGACEPVGYLAP